MIEQVAIVGFAAWRVSSLLVHEDGPGDVFERLRQLVGVPSNGEVSGLLPSLLSCVWCVSIWTALGLWVVWEAWRPEPVVVLAAMSIAPFAERYLGRS